MHLTWSRMYRVLPPCVLLVSLRSWCNGWTTARRSQKYPGRCWLCAGCEGQDSLEHYFQCDTTWRFAWHYLRFPRPELPCQTLLLLTRVPLEIQCLYAMLVYAIYNTRNNHYHNQFRPGDDEALRRIQESLRGLASRFGRCQQLLTSRRLACACPSARFPGSPMPDV